MFSAGPVAVQGQTGDPVASSRESHLAIDALTGHPVVSRSTYRKEDGHAENHRDERANHRTI